MLFRSLLRIIVFSYRKVWLLFTLECSLSALTACGIGLGVGKLAALIITQSANISLAPFGIALGASIIVSMAIGRSAVARSVPSVLRNS